MKHRKILVLLLFAALATPAKSQSVFGTFFADAGMTVGNLKDAYGPFMYGLGMGVEIPIGERIGVGLGAGYTMLMGKEVNDGYNYWTTDDSYFVPIQAFGKYYFTEQQSGFFVGWHMGVHLHEELATVDAYGYPSEPGDKSHTSMSFAPAIGYVTYNMDFSARYQVVRTPGEPSCYLAFRFGILLFANQ